MDVVGFFELLAGLLGVVLECVYVLEKNKASRAVACADWSRHAIKGSETYDIGQLSFGDEALCLSANELLLKLGDLGALWLLVPSKQSAYPYLIGPISRAPTSTSESHPQP